MEGLLTLNGYGIGFGLTVLRFFRIFFWFSVSACLKSPTNYTSSRKKTKVHVNKCEWIWEKGPLRTFFEKSFLIAHNFWSVIAMDLGLAANVLQSSMNIRCKFRALPTSGVGVGVASERLDCIRNRPFYASLQAFSALDRIEVRP